jgi:ABC-type glycerol-3-phosphate transport system substrate-binding protein
MGMKKLSLVMLILLASVLVFASCTGGSSIDQSSAEAVINGYAEAMTSGDLETMYILEGGTVDDSGYADWQNTFNAVSAVAMSDTGATFEIEDIDEDDNVATGYGTSSLDVLSIDWDLWDESLWSGDEGYPDAFAEKAQDDTYMVDSALWISAEKNGDSWYVTSVW